MPDPDAPEARRREAGFLLRVASGRGARILPRLVNRLESLREAEGVSVAKSNRVRTVFRVPDADGAVFVKRYHVAGLFEKVKYVLFSSRPSREWRAARGLRAAGLPVPVALFAGEKRRFGVLKDGLFALEEVPDAEDLVPYVRARLPTSRDRRPLLRDVARLVRRMHDAGYSHGDLHSGNLLVTGKREEPRVYLIDLHTVRRHRKGIGRRLRRTNVARLLHSLTTVTTMADRLRMIRAYEGDAPVLGSERQVRALVERRILSLERRRVRSRTRRCLMNSSVFVRERFGPFRVFRRREVSLPGLLLAIGDHRHAMLTGSRAVLKDAARSAISRQVLPGAPGTGRVVVKETRIRGPGDVVKNAFRQTRGRSSWVNGNGLLVRHVDAARPLALVERGRWPFIRESFLFMEDLCGLTRLDLFVLKRYAGTLSDARRKEKVDLVRAFGRFLGSLHRDGIYHGDLKAVNVFVSSAEGDDPRFFLVDYDRVRFLRSVARRRRVKNLAQVAASVAVLITRTDRLRFGRAWAPDEEAVRHEKALNRSVERALRQKIVVRMKPIE